MNNKGQYAGFIAGFVGVAFLVALFVLLIGYKQVDASHIGVMNRFGVITGTMNPGMQWVGIFTHVEEYDLRVRKMTVEMLTGEQTAIDKDGQTIKARIQVNYRLKPDSAINAYTHVGVDRDMADVLNLDGILREGFKTTTAKYTSTEIWQKRGEVKDEAVKIIENNFPKDYFILDNIIISDIDFNPAFIAAIEQQKTNEKLALAKEQEVAIAKFEADRAVEQAKGTAEANKISIVAQAQAEAEALRLKREQITPLMVQQLWIQAWQAGGAQVPKIVMGQNQGMLMTLPSIDELNKMQ